VLACRGKSAPLADEGDDIVVRRKNRRDRVSPRVLDTPGV
jgi:hypothetical protein